MASSTSSTTAFAAVSRALPADADVVPALPFRPACHPALPVELAGRIKLAFHSHPRTLREQRDDRMKVPPGWQAQPAVRVRAWATSSCIWVTRASTESNRSVPRSRAAKSMAAWAP